MFMRKLKTDIRLLIAAWREERKRRKRLRFLRWQRKARVIMPPPHAGAVAGNWPFSGKGPEAK